MRFFFYQIQIQQPELVSVTLLAFTSICYSVWNAFSDSYSKQSSKWKHKLQLKNSLSNCILQSFLLLACLSIFNSIRFLKCTKIHDTFNEISFASFHQKKSVHSFCDVNINRIVCCLDVDSIDIKRIFWRKTVWI